MEARDILSPQDIAGLKSKGYNEQDIQKAAEDMVAQENELQQSYQQTMATQQQDPRISASNSVFGGYQTENMIKWQLELDNILERIDHMLRGDKIKFDNGHMIWKKADKKKDIVFNNYGVSEIMRVLSMYLNRNTILSNYDEETILLKMFDFGNELADLIYLKYEAFGLSDLEKRKLYPMIVRQIVDIVHSSYLRALNGGERLSLREARQVTQSEQILPNGVTINTGAGGGSRERGMLNPMRYIAGKYK